MRERSTATGWWRTSAPGAVRSAEPGQHRCGGFPTWLVNAIAARPGPGSSKGSSPRWSAAERAKPVARSRGIRRQHRFGAPLLRRSRRTAGGLGRRGRPPRGTTTAVRSTAHPTGRSGTTAARRAGRPAPAPTGAEERGLLFALPGFAGMFGLRAGGIVTDRWGPDRTLATGVGPSSWWWSSSLHCGRFGRCPWKCSTRWAWCGGGAAFWNSPAVPARLHLLTGPASARALALNTSGTCVEVAVGGVVGGVVIDRFGCGPLPVIAAVAGAGALLLFRFAQRSAPATTS